MVDKVPINPLFVDGLKVGTGVDAAIALKAWLKWTRGVSSQERIEMENRGFGEGHWQGALIRAVDPDLIFSKTEQKKHTGGAMNKEGFPMVLFVVLTGMDGDEYFEAYDSLEEMADLKNDTPVGVYHLVETKKLSIEPKLK